MERPQSEVEGINQVHKGTVTLIMDAAYIYI